MALTSNSSSNPNYDKWISQVSKLLQDDAIKIEIELPPVSIFRVPTTLSAFKPEAYVPQLIGLGPYPHFQPNLLEMERYKVASANRLHQKYFKSLEFKQFVDELAKLEDKIRACYHKYLDMEGDALAWVMAIDGLFLLEFLRSYDENRKNFNGSSASTTAHLVDSSGGKLAHGGILGDILMLENQIPIFLLNKMFSITQCSLSDLEDNLLASTLMGFCKALSPLKLHEEGFNLSQVYDRAHLLDLLYHLTVPKLEEPHDTSYVQVKYGASSNVKTPSLDPSKCKQIFEKLWNLLSTVKVVTKITKPIKKVIGSFSKVASHLPGLSSILAPKKKEKTENEGEGDEKKTPIVEEIMIPSVSFLSDAGVEFCATSGGITTIKFDQITKKFFLPVVTLNVNSEVVMRNLVAYEASTVSDSLVFARYTELMNGIIDTAADAKILREKKIIVNSLKSDADVAEVFNGMSKAVRLTNVPYIDKAIVDVNQYFYSTEKVRAYKRLKNFIYGSWLILTVIAALLVMALMGLQTFCSVYSCPRIFHTSNTA